MAFVRRLISCFNAAYKQRPTVTMMASNVVLFATADTVAQAITTVRQRAARKPGGVTSDDRAATEIRHLDRSNPLAKHDLVPDSLALPPPFDLVRLGRFAVYGLILAPVQYRWFLLLGRWFPVSSSTSALVQTVKRVACDQLIFGPAGVAFFFSFMAVAEGGGLDQVKHKMRDVFWPTLKRSYFVWPAVQLVNFRLVPMQFQLPFVSSVGIAWTAYLSLTNAADDAENYEDQVARGQKLSLPPR